VQLVRISAWIPNSGMTPDAMKDQIKPTPRPYT
jgi:hypothetical protein